MTAVTAEDSLPAVITVLPTSRATRWNVGPLAWVVLEELAFRAKPGLDGLAVETTVRDLATSLAAGKDVVAAALNRLAEAGLVECGARRRAGRYAGSVYLLDAGACRRAGLLVPADRVVPTPCSSTPCPAGPCSVEPVAAQGDLAIPDHPAAAGAPPVSPSPVPDPAVSRSSLFDTLTEPATVSTTPPVNLATLPTGNQADTSAPVVRQRGRRL